VHHPASFSKSTSELNEGWLELFQQTLKIKRTFISEEKGRAHVQADERVRNNWKNE